ncbi:NAD(P)-dependent oxidoreductase [Nakamurella flavida]|uniref:NAD(P)-dependent oxidoreductase n=1 Tax=Nakamurella flavida TaxID=363630 RepID=A0A939C6B6_9ACTN|nr:NAD(P)-dependent oxidoreductase [Nakamurella flavida]MBM9477869.1 NAD(P)-dependent oxidoreductase [Nakamurella flavida]MDP9778417.1 nucleoside-diphosphate-sugar epimerase [Nakamurella flavida]
MTRIAVTGGSGKLGRAVVRHLVEEGHQVYNLDRTPSPDALAPYIQIDLTDPGQVHEALRSTEDVYDGIDAVVHLGAIPRPGLTTNSATFDNNIRSTHNVFAAAKSAGIRNVVWASSETVLGLPLGPENPPPYIPVDEEYHPQPNSSYSLAKTLEEEMALQFCRWDPALKMIGLRFSNVMYPEDYREFPSFDADPATRVWNMWGYIDARDGAQAVRKAVELDATGMQVFVIANADTVMSRSSLSLAEEVFPDVPLRRRDLGQHETLLSIDKARRILGFDPQHSWRNEI